MSKQGGEKVGGSKSTEDKMSEQINERAVSPNAADFIARDFTSSDSSSNIKHKRVFHRLQTARWVIWGGLFFIFTISMFFLYASSCSLEEGIRADTIFITGVSTIASIVTLALGYIAGSNIER